MPVSDTRRTFEIVAVLITGAGKFIFVDLLPLKFWYIALAILGWIAYIIVRSRQQKGILQYWGFTSENFRKLFFTLLPFVVFAVICFILYCLLHNKHLLVNGHLLLTLLVYPLWGIVQQFLMISLIAGNLQDLKKIKMNRLLIILVTATSFALVHFPSGGLVAATFVLSSIYTPLFLQYRNIWPLGIYHGWLAGFFYFFVLNRDPWIEVFIAI